MTQTTHAAPDATSDLVSIDSASNRFVDDGLARA